MKLLAVFGTRPEAIKMAPVIKAFAKDDRFQMKVCVTAQHRSMLDQVLTLYNIKPNYDLNIMTKDQSLVSVTQKILIGLEAVFNDEKPDWILVQGDTNTTLAAALAAYYQKIPVAHIEAGLRTNHIYSPWPEEINRQLTTRIASLHFAPTANAEKNLLKEAVQPENIFITGNTVIDALLETVKHLNQEGSIVQQQFPFLDKNKKLILLTSHRRENFGEGLESLCRAMVMLSQRDDVQIVYPVHLNPNIQNPVTKYLMNRPNIILLPPQEYLAFVYLMSNAYIIITDSGGIQEEAPSLGKPVLVVRDTTERPEAVAAGTALLVGTDEQKIFKEASQLLDDEDSYLRMSTIANPYGDGKAAQRIVECLYEKSI